MISLIFMGTPDFALPALDALCGSSEIDLKAVVCPPDRRSGRGMKVVHSPVKRRALELSLGVFQPSSLRYLDRHLGGAPDAKGPALEDLAPAKRSFLDFLASVSAVDIAVTVAYGLLIPKSLLRYPRFGILNIHPSLLPRWRGAAPIQRAILEGDDCTGVTLMSSDEGLDTGPLYSSRTLAIGDTDNYALLHDRLSGLAAEFLIDSLPSIVSGKLSPVPQDDSSATYASKWEKADSRIDWSEDSQRVLRRIRASSPPGATTTLGAEPLKISAASPVGSTLGPVSLQGGEICEVSSDRIVVGTGDSCIAIEEMQFAGSRSLRVAEILKGREICEGAVFGK